MTDIRKNLLIIIFLLSGAFLILLFLNFSSSWKKSGASILENSTASINLPKKISRGPVNFFNFRGGSDRVIFYEEPDSIVYESDPDGRNKKELVKIPDVLKKEVFVFSPDAGKIAYYFFNKELNEGNVFTANPDGSEIKTVFRTRIKDLKLKWPESDLILLYSGEGPGSAVFSITSDGGKFQKMSEEEISHYQKNDLEGIDILEGIGVETTNSKLSPLKDYLIFTSIKDGKLYSLKL